MRKPSPSLFPRCQILRSYRVRTALAELAASGNDVFLTFLLPFIVTCPRNSDLMFEMMLDAALDASQESTVRLLVNNDPSVYTAESTISYFEIIIHRAVQCARPPLMVKALFDLAVEKVEGYEDCCEEIFRRVSEQRGESLLYNALSHNDLELVKVLLDLGATQIEPSVSVDEVEMKRVLENAGCEFVSDSGNSSSMVKEDAVESEELKGVGIEGATKGGGSLLQVSEAA